MGVNEVPQGSLGTANGIPRAPIGVLEVQIPRGSYPSIPGSSPRDPKGPVDDQRSIIDDTARYVGWGYVEKFWLPSQLSATRGAGSGSGPAARFFRILATVFLDIFLVCFSPICFAMFSSFFI